MSAINPKDGFCWTWLDGAMCVLVPSKNGRRWLANPIWHNSTWKTKALEEGSGCDACGLDGTLDFMCGGSISAYRERQIEFEKKVFPIIERVFQAKPNRRVSMSEIEQAMFS